MTPSASLGAIVAAQADLLAALDAGAVEAIEDATRALAVALERLRASGVVLDDGSAADSAAFALRQTEAARMRVNYLADQTRRRRERLAQVRGGAEPSTYLSLAPRPVLRCV